MNRFALLLGASLLFAHTNAVAQFVPIGDLPDVPENPVQIHNMTTEQSVADTSEETDEDKVIDGGSQTVADFLELLSPGVDTRIPESASQAASRISNLISKGKTDKALAEIAKLEEASANDGISTNVQLMFLKARAYTAKGDIAQALDTYQTMTYRYPELAEPWNNMAILQAKAGSLDEALASLQMALSIRPDYPIANKNIGLIYSLLAKRSFEKSDSLKK